MGLYDTRSWNLIARTNLHAAPHAIQFTPNGRYIVDVAVVSEDVDGPTGLRIWSVPELKLLGTIKNVYTGSPSHYMDISSDGHYVAVAGSMYLGSDEGISKYEGVIRIYRLDNYQDVISARRQIGELHFSRHAAYLLVEGVGSEAINIYRTRDLSLAERVAIGETIWVTDIALSPDRTRLALCTGRDIWVWQVHE